MHLSLRARLKHDLSLRKEMAELEAGFGRACEISVYLRDSGTLNCPRPQQTQGETYAKVLHPPKAPSLEFDPCVRLRALETTAWPVFYDPDALAVPFLTKCFPGRAFDFASFERIAWSRRAKSSVLRFLRCEVS